MRLLLISLLLLVVSGCQSLPKQPASSVQHVVMVWFKEDVTEQQIEEVIAQSYRLPQQIPLIKSIHVGRAIPSERKIVDDSFDIGLVMNFSSREDMQAYVNHPLHKQFVSQYVKGRVSKLQVYDF